MGRRILLAAMIALGLAACAEPANLPSEDVCHQICECLYALPAQVDECYATCTGRLGPPSPACLECLDGADCSEVTTCLQPCVVAPLTPLESSP